MALNLSDLTGSSTSGDILAEVQTTADFLDSVPLLKNLADPSGATDAKQFTATKQPIALPLTKDSNGVLGGYLYQPDVTGNAPAVDIPTINANEDFVFEMEVYLVAATSFHLASGGDVNHRFAIHNGYFYFSPESAALNSPLSTGASTLTVERSGTTATLKQNGVVKATLGANIADNIFNLTHLSFNGQYITSIGRLNGYIKKATLSVEGTEVFNCDFTSPRIPHGASEFTCETGQVVTVNTSGNNPAKVIKKPVLRFDGADDGLKAILGSTLNSGHAFIAFSVNGPTSGSGRVFGANPVGGEDYVDGFLFAYKGGAGDDNILSYYNGSTLEHHDMYDDNRGDILHEAKISDGNQSGKINDANFLSSSYTSYPLKSVSEFNIAQNEDGVRLGGEYTSIDLEYLALFPATLTDSQADQVRNFINNRNKVFTLIDSQGYYWFDAAATDDGQVFTGSGSWNGRIVGSDNGDADMFIGNGTAADRPTTDGYKITFADNTDHFDTPQITLAAGDSYAWMVCGTSLGTFAYKVTVSGQTELNLLGHLGDATQRKAGDLYGIILLPQNATNRDIEEARKLLIDRGAGDGATTTNYDSAWNSRSDITEFSNVAFTGVTSLNGAWINCSNLSSFNVTSIPDATGFDVSWQDSGLTSFSTELPKATNVGAAWRNCASLTSFNVKSLPEVTRAYASWRNSGLTSFSTELPKNYDSRYAWLDCSDLASFTTTDIKKCNNFTAAWQGCTSLQSFPEDALLGTEATNVNFSNAWRSSGLESFSTPLPTATSITASWRDCYSLASFDISELPLVVDSRQAFLNCDLSTFSTEIPKSKAFQYCWAGCSSLTDFSADVFANWNPISIYDSVFDLAWDGCSSLTAQSVENILVGISNSGKWPTTSGLEGGTAITDATIDIDYDVSTGSLTAATLSAIETLNGRGWSVNINNEIIVPNILQLQPAAAYSLRSFDADADPTVVNVRRSSDGSLSDFTASQVSDGTLRDWTLGDALALDGERMYFQYEDSNYVDLNHSFIPATGDFSVSFKYLHNTPAGNNMYIFTQGSSVNTFIGVSVNTNGLTAVFVDGSNSGSFAPMYLSVGQIYEMKLTRVGDVFTFYLDGVATGSQTVVGKVIPTDTDTFFGAATWTTNRYITGVVYDIKKDDVLYYKGYGNTNADWTDQVGSNDATVFGSPALFSGQGFDGYVTTWFDQKIINETGDAYGTTISGTADGTSDTYLNVAPAVAGEYYRVRYTLSNLNPRGRVRFRNAANNADLTAVSGTAALTYIYEDGSYETVVPSDDGLSLWFTADVGQSFDYSGISVQQVDNYQNNSTQSTASSQPLIVENGVLVTEGGEAALSFDGDDFILINHSDIYGQATLDSYYVTSTSDTQYLYPANSTGNTYGFVAEDGSPTTTLHIGYGTPTFFANGAQFTGTTRNDVYNLLNGYKLAVHQGASTINSDWPQDMRLGSYYNNTSYTYTGKLQEMIFFNTDQSANRVAIQNNINDHYSIY